MVVDGSLRRKNMIEEKGYYLPSCYMGWNGHEYQQFETVDAYHEWCAEINNLYLKEDH